MTDPAVLAAGGVLWRAGATGIELAVVHRPRFDDWSLPKGKLDPGEHWLQAAVREVAEETGWRGVAEVALGADHYPVALPDGRTAVKTVRWWAMSARGPDADVTVSPAEIDGVDWLAADVAEARLTWARDRDRVRALAALPRPTTTVLLVRHASAGRRSAWTGDDRDRPLDTDGQRQALQLAAVLPAFGPDTCVAAPLRRCRQTLQPLADRLGVAVDHEPRLAEGAAVEPALALLRHWGVVGRRVVACSQGGLIPDLVATLASADGVATPTVSRPGGPPSRKASSWALTFAGPRLIAADYLPDVRPALAARPD